MASEARDIPDLRKEMDLRTAWLRRVGELLDAVRIPHRTLSEQTAVDDLKWTAETFMKQRIPLALLLKKGVVRGIQP